MRMRAWEGVLARRPYACALTTVSMTVVLRQSLSLDLSLSLSLSLSFSRFSLFSFGCSSFVPAVGWGWVGEKKVVFVPVWHTNTTSSFPLHSLSLSVTAAELGRLSPQIEL